MLYKKSINVTSSSKQNRQKKNTEHRKTKNLFLTEKAENADFYNRYWKK